MSRSASATHARARDARLSFLRYPGRVLLALIALVASSSALAQPCNLQPVPPTFVIAPPSGPATFSFQIVDGNISVPIPGACDNSTGTIAITNPPGSGAMLGATTWSGNTGDIVSFSATASPTVENSVISVNCTGGNVACTAGTTNGTSFVLQTVIRTVDTVSGDGAAGDPGATLQLEAAALNNGLRPFTSVPIEWQVTGGNATVLPASGLSGQYSQAITTVTLGTATSTADNTVTVTATRTDAPEAAPAVFTLTINVYELIQVSPADGSTAPAGSVVPLIVELRRNGLPLGSTNIDWAFTPAPANGSLLGPSPTATLGDGTATNNLTVGQPNPGNPPADIVVTATAFAGSPAIQRSVDFVIAPRDAIAFGGITGDGQSAAINTAFALPLGLTSTRNGAPDSGSTINWSVNPPGAATLASNATLTDANGTTSNVVTAGASTGPFTVTATHADDSTVTHTFGLAAFDKRLIKPATGSGDGQTGAPNQALAQPLVAIATLNGSPEPGVPVTWIVTAGDASITSSTSPTDGSGRSTAQVMFGPTAGSVTVQAERTDKPGEIQIYTLTAADVRTLEKPPTGSGDGQVVEPGQTSQPLLVIARNNGIAAPGVVVLWSVTGDATLSTNQTTTAGDGSTSVDVRIGTSQGTITVTASRQDAPSATASFVLNAVEPNLTLELATDSGNGTQAPPGTAVTLRALARRNGVADANVGVFFEVLSGSAQIGRTLVNTGSNGIAATAATLGSAGPIQIRASRTDRPSASVLFNLVSTTTGTGDEFSIVEGDGQSGLPGSAGAPLKVRYTRNGVAVPGIPVTWTVVTGSASLASASTTTIDDGTAQVGITFGQTPGPVAVRAEAGGRSVLFALSVRTSDTGGLNLRLVSGAGQTGPIGTRADLPIVLEVTNGSGQPVSAQAIEWQVVSGSATLDSLLTSTGVDGRSSQGLRFGTTAGPIVLRAKLPGPTVNAVEIHATSFVPTLVIVSGNNQTGPVSTALPQDFVVAISVPPSVSKTLAGLTIQWQVTEGNGTLSASTSVTGADGRASNRLVLGPASGNNRVTASIAGGGSVTFNATGQADAAPLVIVSGNNQTLPTQSDSAPLVVELKTTAGVPIQGASLVWTSDNAQTRTARTTTGADGRASNVARVLMPGAARVTVRVEGTNSASGTVAFVINGGVANIPRLNRPEQTLGNAIDQLCPALFAASNLTPAQTDLLARCLELVNNAGDHPDQVENALQQMQQDVALAQANAALVTAATQFDNLKARIAALRSGRSGADFGGLAVATSSGVMPLSFLPSSVVQEEGAGEGGGEAEVGADFSRWGFFAAGIIGRGEQEAGSITPEYDFDTNGLTAGVDYRFNDQWFAGVSLGYNQQDTELTDDSGGIDTTGWSISGYTSWFHQNNWYVDGVLTFGSNDYDLTRRIIYDIVAAGGGLTRVDQLAEASTGGDQLSAALSFGRDFQSGAWNYGPYLRATYTRVEFDSYEERLENGTGMGLGLEVDSRSLKSMTGVLGGKVTYALSRDWGILMPHAQLEWEHEFKDDPQQLVTRFLHDPTGTSIRMNGDAVDSDYYNIGFGLSALFPGGRSAFLYYEHLAGSEGLSQDNLSLGVRIEF